MNENEKELIEGQVEVEGFDYAMTECISENEITDEKFKQLRRAYMKARQELAGYLGMEGEV